MRRQRGPGAETAQLGELGELGCINFPAVHHVCSLQLKEMGGESQNSFGRYRNVQQSATAQAPLVTDS